MQKPGASFLHEKNPNFHASPEVETVAGYLRESGESIPNQPTNKLAAYLGFIASIEYVNDGILTGDEASIDRQAEAASVSLTPENAQAYAKFQVKVARELGRGGEVDLDTLDNKTKMDALRLVRKDQQKQLHEWTDELNSEDNKYPDWFKYWMFESVKRHTAFNEEVGKNGQPKGFERRSASSFAPFPELDRESVSLAYDALTEKLGGERMGFEYERMRALLTKANFGELYAEAQNYGFKITDELKAVTTGSWHDFEQSDHHDDAQALSEFIRTYRTGWCTAGAETASTQLSTGDFYVWCSTNPDNGRDEVPRVAVRMEQGVVAEVRGIVGGQRQELESQLADTVTAKISNLPGGEQYFKKAEAMKRVTDIEKRQGSGQELTQEDLAFLYETNDVIEGFGYEKDPRIDELRQKRDWHADMALMSGKETEAEIAEWILEQRDAGYVLADALVNGKFTQLDGSVALRLIYKPNIPNTVVGAIAANMDVFQGLNHNQFAKTILDSGEIGYLMANITSFRDLSLEVADHLMAVRAPVALYYGVHSFPDFDNVDDSKFDLSTTDRRTLDRMDSYSDEEGRHLTPRELWQYYGLDLKSSSDAVKKYATAMLAAAHTQRDTQTKN